MSATQAVVMAVLGLLALGLGVLARRWWPEDDGPATDDEIDLPTGRHHLGLGHDIPVAELLTQAAEAGDPLRLNWPDKALDERGMVRPAYRDDLPTGFISQIRD
ncbi:hypothetical protein BBK82_13610 [Lentzea guizhouensis]|uniref:Uncharacterized protein n=1 Tax=Lentzea guizhouensis TaxID=1586287 RepID=A0A1B2HGV2_9PSEU|nr:hypothetical protein [Lentzea guizhouensis]ANZ36955.1 hypothetical protein BBK82_13610 [Lentzea guizhouensis]